MHSTVSSSSVPTIASALPSASAVQSSTGTAQLASKVIALDEEATLGGSQTSVVLFYLNVDIFFNSNSAHQNPIASNAIGLPIDQTTSNEVRYAFLLSLWDI